MSTPIFSIILVKCPMCDYVSYYIKSDMAVCDRCRRVFYIYEEFILTEKLLSQNTTDKSLSNQESN